MGKKERKRERDKGRIKFGKLTLPISEKVE